MASRSSKTPSRQYHRNFKSPLSSKVDKERSIDGSYVQEEIKNEMNKLVEECEQLDVEIQEIKSTGCEVEELQSHIEKLHEYNDIKDAGQMILGQLASIKGLTTRQLYEQYQLKEDD